MWLKCSQIEYELEAISNNTTDDVVVKADGKIGNSTLLRRLLLAAFCAICHTSIHEKKNW